MFLVREGNSQDFRAYINGQEYPRAWCKTAPEGLVVFDTDEHLVAIALVTVDAQDCTWVWFDQKTALPPVVLHRHALELLNSLRASGRAVHAFVDSNEPTAEKWFRRLGFVPADMVIHPTGEERLAWVR